MIRPIRALVVDDEPRARSRLRRLLEPHTDVVVVGEAATGSGAVKQVLALQPDLVFLDVRMPDGQGTEAVEQLRSFLPESVRPAVVFTTAHAEHAVQAFALEGVDYLLKPIERDRLAQALRRVRQSRWSQRPAAPMPAPEPDRGFLTGHHGASMASIAVGALLSIQVEDGVAFAHTVDGERTRLQGSLAELEAELSSPPFVRVSRSAIVNAERVLRIHPVGSSYEAELENGHRVAVSRRRVKRLEMAIGL